jgi:hypothetical protein
MSKFWFEWGVIILECKYSFSRKLQVTTLRLKFENSNCKEEN